MSTLAPLLRELRASLHDDRTSGVTETGVPGVSFFWIDHALPRSPLLYDTGLVIVGQGRKIGYLGGRQFRYDAESCLVLGVPVPFECEVQVDDEPLLGIRVDLDPARIHALVAKFAAQLGFEGAETTRSGVEPVAMRGALLDATRRLLESLRDPMDSQAVGPAAVDEIVYRVLRSEHGRVLYDLTQHRTHYASVARALERMHRDYRKALTIDELAHESAMSASSFHRAFKAVTGESPLQYLKKTRLLKAKAALLFEGLGVEEAAYEVGYASASQFSREFKRYFRVPPSEAHTLPYGDPLERLVFH
ncbi:MAG: AraC family transcriptional regulator [Polyangiales bacterium]